jgi:hypothetical protein
MRRPDPISAVCFVSLVCWLAVPVAAQAQDAPPVDYSVGSSPGDLQVRIRVMDEDGKPVPRARLLVELDRPDFGATRDDVPYRRAVIYTKADGVTSVWYPPKPAGIVVSAEGFAPQLLRNVELTKHDPFPIRLNKGQPIRGRVLRADGKPVADAHVGADSKTPPLSHFYNFSLDGHTAADGTFELPHAAPGEYRLSVHVHDEQSPAFVETVTVKVEAASPPPPLELPAKPAAALAGSIISAHDVAVRDLRVRAYTEAPHGSFDQTSSKPDGSFVLTAGPPGANGYVTLRCPPGYVAAYDAPSGPGSLRQDGSVLRFTGLPAGIHEGLVIRLLKEATVTGVVRNEEGKPVPNLRVVARPNNRLFQTDADGRYQASVTPDADVTLEFSTDKNAPQLATASLRAAEGQRVEKDVTIRREPPQR